MYHIKPVDGKWTSLAYYHHLLLGWNNEVEGDSLLVEIPKEALDQFNTIDNVLLESKTAEILGEICHLFEEGIKNNAVILIQKD